MSSQPTTPTQEPATTDHPVTQVRKRIRAHRGPCIGADMPPMFRLDMIFNEMDSLFSQYSSIMVESFLTATHIDTTYHRRALLNMLSTLDRVERLHREESVDELCTTEELLTDPDVDLVNDDYPLWLPEDDEAHEALVKESLRMPFTKVTTPQD